MLIFPWEFELDRPNRLRAIWEKRRIMANALMASSIHALYTCKFNAWQLDNLSNFFFEKNLVNGLSLYKKQTCWAVLNILFASFTYLLKSGEKILYKLLWISRSRRHVTRDRFTEKVLSRLDNFNSRDPFTYLTVNKQKVVERVWQKYRQSKEFARSESF